MQYRKEARRISEERKEQFADDPDSPQQLASIGDEIEARIQGTKKEIYKIGELLVGAKEILRYGKFKKWVKERFGNELSYQTAINWMRVYKCCLGRPSIVNTISTSILYQLAAPSFPKTLRTHIFEHADDLNEIKNKDMKKIIEEFKKGKLAMDSPQIQELFKFNRNRTTYKNYAKQVTDGIDQVRKLKDTVLSATNKFEWPIHPEKKQTILSNNQWTEVDESIDEIITAIKAMKPEKSSISIKPELKLIEGSKG